MLVGCKFDKQSSRVEGNQFHYHTAWRSCFPHSHMLLAYGTCQITHRHPTVGFVIQNSGIARTKEKNKSDIICLRQNISRT